MEFNGDGEAPAVAFRGSGLSRCDEGALSAEEPAVGRTTTTYSALYQIGPLDDGEVTVYVVYRTVFGAVVLPPQTVDVQGGRVGRG